MSKRSRSRQYHSNPTTEHNRRSERVSRIDKTVYQELAATGRITRKSKRRYKELAKLHGLI